MNIKQKWYDNQTLKQPSLNWSTQQFLAAWDYSKLIIILLVFNLLMPSGSKKFTDT